MPARAYVSAYYFPPVPSVGVLRNAAVVEALRVHFARVDVVTRRVPSTDDRAKARDGLAGAAVYRHEARVFDYRTRLQSADFNPSEQLKRGRAYRTFLALANGFPSNLIFGEGAWLYILTAVLKLSRLIEGDGRGCVLYTSFRPWADVQVGYVLKRRFPNLTWWCDWRDTPFEQRRDYGYAPRFQRWVLCAMLGHADLVTAVSDGVATDLRTLGVPAGVLRNGAVQPHPADTIATPRPEIVYTGSLYGDDRDPMPVFAALAKLLEAGLALGLSYAGKDGRQWSAMVEQSGLKSVSTVLGMLDHSATLRLQKSAAVSLLLTWSNPRQTGGLTMKAYEYLQAGQPILRIHDGSADAELDALLEASGAPHYTYTKGRDDPAGMLEWLREHIESYRVRPLQAGFGLRENLERFVQGPLAVLLDAGA